MTTKICCSCKQEKPIECFSKNKSSTDGLKQYCKECAKIYTKRYREKHKDEIKKRKVEAYWKDKERAEERTEKQLAEGLRVCTRCGIEKPIADFPKRGNGGFYSQCYQCVKEITKQYRINNRDKVIARKRKYHKDHKVEIDAYNKQYYQTHKDEIQQRVKDWTKANPEQARENGIIGIHDRRFRKEGLASDFTRSDWKKCKEYFSEGGKTRCAYCGKPLERATIDHVIPIKSGGTNTVNNIVPSCLKCNSTKFDHPMSEWYRKQPFYSEERERKIETYLNQ